MSDQTYGDRVLAAAREAVSNGSAELLSLAGVSFRLRWAGERLRSAFLPSVRHLIVPDTGDPHPEILTVDTLESGCACPLPPAGTQSNARGDVLGVDGGRTLGAYNGGVEARSWYPENGDTGVYWATDAARLPQYEIAAPFRTLWHWMLRAHGVHLFHAAAVGLDGRGVLLVGEGGAGKSTTALACAAAGMDYLADDYVAVSEAADGSVWAHALYARAKLTDRSLELLPEARSWADAPRMEGEEKTLVAMDAARGVAFVRRIRVVAVLAPEVRAVAAPALEPLPAGEAARRLAVSTLRQLNHAGPSHLAAAGRILRNRPVRRLILGGPPKSATDLIAHLIRQLPDPHA